MRAWRRCSLRGAAISGVAEVCRVFRVSVRMPGGATTAAGSDRVGQALESDTDGDTHVGDPVRPKDFRQDGEPELVPLSAVTCP